MGKDLSYCVLFLLYFILVSSNPVKDSLEDEISQGFERERDGINIQETIADRVCKIYLKYTLIKLFFQILKAIGNGRFNQVLKRNQR